MSLQAAMMVAGLSGGSGKSVVSVGLIAALAQRGEVAGFKKGPDYIDAGWISKAAGRPCYNLDPYLMEWDEIYYSWYRGIGEASFALVEGNRGLYDGVNVEGGFSSAELARKLKVPVILVVNCSKTTRTVAAQVLGCINFEPDVSICGVILNQIVNPRHEQVIRQSVEKYTGLPVLGIVPRLKKDIFPMRHLGVLPCAETDLAADTVCELAELARDNFDLDKICRLTSVSNSFAGEPSLLPERGAIQSGEARVRIGVIRDAAFQFYYQENLDALAGSGAELVMIDALAASELPEIDALYIGGGFPETNIRELSANLSFMRSLRDKIESGLPVYAECGGLIFLGRELFMDGESFPLVGVFPVGFTMSAKPQAHGYSIFRVDRKNPYHEVGSRVKGHEFRYSVVNLEDDVDIELCFSMERGTGFTSGKDGLKYKNVIALYTHIIAGRNSVWPQKMVQAAFDYKNKVV